MKNDTTALKSELKRNIKLQRRHLDATSRIHDQLGFKIEALNDLRSRVANENIKALETLASMLDMMEELTHGSKSCAGKRGKKLPS